MSDYRADQTFLLWFAGFWEGEGSLSFSGRGVALDVCQSGERGKQAIMQVREKFGFGQVYVDRQRSPRQPRYIWRVTSVPLVIKVLKDILPYLRFRREEVEEKLARLLEMDHRASRHRWTEWEIAYLKENYGKVPPKTIAENLGRHTVKAVWMKAKQLRLVKPRVVKRWTIKEVEQVRFLKRRGLTIQKIALQLGRTRDSVAKVFARV
jgi:hypothetical protein